MKNIKNKFVIGDAGTGKTDLLTKLLNATELNNLFIFICGDFDNPKVDNKNLDKALGCTMISSVRGLITDRQNGTDLNALEIQKSKYPDGECLVIIDESQAASDPLIKQLTEDVERKRISLWIAVQSFEHFFHFWSPDLLNNFDEFYLFNSWRCDQYLNESTIQFMEKLKSGPGAYLYHSAEEAETTESIFSPKLTNRLREAQKEKNGELV